MRVICTDNHGGDYPNEKFMCESLPLKEATEFAAELNKNVTDWSDDYFMVVDDDYVLIPGFEA